MSKPIAINVPILARVEGEGALELTIKDATIESLQLKIYEPPRLFEAFLAGRSYEEILDLVARICGICPVAYQMSAVHAIENCFGLNPGPWVRAMRRLFYCGEWIESHSLHIHLLAAADFLGFESAAEMAKCYPEAMRRGLRLQSFGNELIKLLGGRSVHPVGACVGGFYHAPKMEPIGALLAIARERVEDCKNLLTWLASFVFPDQPHDFVCVSLYHPDEYPMNEGDIISDQGLKISIEQFRSYFKEQQVSYSNALHCKLNNGSYLVGPLARVNNCYQLLPEEIHEVLRQLKMTFPSKNMHDSILARAIEIYYCVLESIRILEHSILPDSPRVKPKIRAGVGFGCTEAPRGLLWQSYEVDETGKIKSVNIVPPTSQNQARIEDDIKISLLKFGLEKPTDELRLYCERLIRNYDPCISCATHFIQLKVKRL